MRLIMRWDPMAASTHRGRCFSGSVEFAVSGEPALMGYCHCRSCREWSASPVNAWALYTPDSVKITKGLDNIETYRRTDRSLKKWCKTCGGHLFADLSMANLVDVFAAVIPSLRFDPTMHIHYQETVLRMIDG